MSSLATFLIGLAARRSAATFERAVAHPLQTQTQLLLQMMERNKDTEYGKRYDFGSVRSIGDFQARVPVVDYEDIRGDIDRIVNGEGNVLTAEKPVLFAQTSGTTGTPKYIPVTPTCRKAGGMTTWMHFARKDHPRMFSGKLMTVVSPAIEGHTQGGIPYGSTSGMVVKEMPKLVQSAYAVPYVVFEIESYDAKYYAILRLGLAENITFIGTANPSSILKLAEFAHGESERLIKDVRDGTLTPKITIAPAIRKAIEGRLRADPNRAKELERCRSKRDGFLLPFDYWPNMALLGCWKGGTVGAYIERLKPWYDPDGAGMVPVRDMGYLASEARMSIPISDRGSGGVLTVHINFFEFVSTEDVEAAPDNVETWKFRPASELKVGAEYYVFVTTSGGLYRYDMNDVIEAVSTFRNTPVIEFRRKGRGMTNITGEKLSVNQVIAAINTAAEAEQIKVGHFRAEPDVANARYVLKIEFDSPVNETQAQSMLARVDAMLKQLNIEYAGKRGSKRLKSPVLQIMKQGWYDRGKQKLVNEGKRLFQAKTILLDSKMGYSPEPDELVGEYGLRD